MFCHTLRMCKVYGTEMRFLCNDPNLCQHSIFGGNKNHVHWVARDQNPKYMELLMVREGIHRWMVENKNRFLAESEMGKSQAILAAKDMVDSIQDMLEEVSKMQNEQMPALLDTIRDQIGMEQADAFKNSVGTLLASMVEQLGAARESADQAARALAGEQVAQPMGMGVSGGMGGGMPSSMGGGLPGQLPTDTGDEFAATDAAAGGPDVIGREKR